MEKSLHEFLATKIQLLSGQKVQPEAVSIDAKNGRITGFVGGNYFFPAASLVLREDVWEFEEEPQQKSQKTGNNWLGFRVENRDGKRRGKVTNLWIDDEFFSVTKLEAVSSFLGLLHAKKIYESALIFKVIPSKKRIVIEEEPRVFQKAEMPLQTLRPFSALGNACHMTSED